MEDEIKFTVNGNPFVVTECSFQEGWVFCDILADVESTVYPTAVEAQQSALVCNRYAAPPEDKSIYDNDAYWDQYHKSFNRRDYV